MGIIERWGGEKIPPAFKEEFEGKLKELRDFISARFASKVLTAYLFGSLARSKGKGFSDVDLAVLTRRDLLPGEFIELAGGMAVILGTEQVDITLLNSSSPLFTYKVISEGKAFYCSDSKRGAEFELFSLKEYMDTAFLRHDQYEILKREIALVKKIDEEAIKERLKKLRSVLAAIEPRRGVSVEEYLGDEILRLAVERALILAAEVVVDIVSHILASEYAVFPATYEEAIEKGRAKGILSEELYARLAGLGRFRNLLIHVYVKTDDRLVYQYWQKSKEIFFDFIAEVTKKLEQMT
jgi:uncharacterized protein YutE (UPF0331/DUF86 family)/predicted nucleotidyltransferase